MEEEKLNNIINLLNENNNLVKKEIELLNKIYLLFSQYDSEYHTEIEKENNAEIPK